MNQEWIVNLKTFDGKRARHPETTATDTKNVPSSGFDSGFAKSHLVPSCVVGETKVIPNKMVQRAANWPKIKEVKRNNKGFPNYSYKVSR